MVKKFILSLKFNEAFHLARGHSHRRYERIQFDLLMKYFTTFVWVAHVSFFGTAKNNDMIMPMPKERELNRISFSSLYCKNMH